MPSDADQITNLDTELDALVSPTSAQTQVVTRDYDAGIVAASAARRALAGLSSGASVPDFVIETTDPAAIPFVFEAAAGIEDENYVVGGFMKPGGDPTNTNDYYLSLDPAGTCQITPLTDQGDVPQFRAFAAATNAAGEYGVQGFNAGTATNFINARPDTGLGFRQIVGGATKVKICDTSLALFGANGSTQQAHINDPAGGGTQDAEARAAIVSILNLLEAYGLMAT